MGINEFLKTILEWIYGFVGKIGSTRLNSSH